MATVLVVNRIGVMSGGTYTKYGSLTWSPTKTLTAIAGVLNTTLGYYWYRTGNGLNGGMPNQGQLVYTIYSASGTTVPSSGTYTEYSSLTWTPTKTLTKIAGVLNTTLGSYHKQVIGKGFMGISTPPTLPAKAIVFVSM